MTGSRTDNYAHCVVGLGNTGARLGQVLGYVLYGVALVHQGHYKVATDAQIGVPFTKRANACSVLTRVALIVCPARLSGPERKMPEKYIILMDV